MTPGRSSCPEGLPRHSSTLTARRPSPVASVCSCAWHSCPRVFWSRSPGCYSPHHGSIYSVRELRALSSDTGRSATFDTKKRAGSAGWLQSPPALPRDRRKTLATMQHRACQGMARRASQSKGKGLI